MNEKRHILLRGARGVGKSTLLRRLIEAADAVPGGFLTKKAAADESGVSHIHIYPASCLSKPLHPTDENRIGSCMDGRMLSRCREAFDTLGVSYLHNTAGCDVLLMDELGFMEAEAARFQQSVLQALDGDLPVLAAVKDKPIPFLERICSHPNVTVWQLTPENRAALFDEIYPIFCSLLRKQGR